MNLLAKCLSCGIKGLALVTIGAGVMLLAAEPAEAKKRGRGSVKSASCCKVYGIYQARQTHTHSKNERFFTAISYSSGGR